MRNNGGNGEAKPKMEHSGNFKSNHIVKAGNVFTIWIPASPCYQWEAEEKKKSFVRRNSLINRFIQKWNDLSCDEVCILSLEERDWDK